MMAIEKLRKQVKVMEMKKVTGYMKREVAEVEQHWEQETG